MVSEEQIKEVIEKTDIVALVSQYVPLEKAGSVYKGLCPFHNEKTPSFTVSPQKKIAKCFGCGGGGNPIKFLMQIKNISFTEALKELARDAGIKLEGLKEENSGPDYSNYYKIMETAHKFFRYNLTNTTSGDEAIKYLLDRGIDMESINAFEIGLAPDKSDALYNVLKNAGFNELDMFDLGLVKNGEHGFYDLFKNRIMFPVKDERGHIIAFSGRIFVNDPSQPKYVNSPETVIFKKGQTLFHLYDAISDIRKNHQIVLHEGQMDVIASYRSGITTAICSMGTALTPEQVKIIAKYANNVVVCYDGDNAGLKAMVKAIRLFANQNINLRLVILPDGMDPDEYVKKYGKEAFLNFFNNNLLDPSDFMVRYVSLNRNFSNMADIEAAKKEIFEYLKLNSSQILIERVLEKLANIMNVSKASLMIDFNNNSYNSQEFEQNQFMSDVNPSLEVASSLPQAIRSHARAELRLLNYGKLSKDFASRIEENSALEKPFMEYLEPVNQKIWSELVDNYYIYHKEFNEGEFVHCLDQNLLNAYVSNISVLKENGDDMNKYSEEDMNECLKALINYSPIKEIDQIDQGFSNLKDNEKLANLILKLEKLRKINKVNKKN